MRIDSLARTAALAVIPMVALTAYWLARETPALGVAPASSASAERADSESLDRGESDIEDAEDNEETEPMAVASVTRARGNGAGADRETTLRVVGDRLIDERLPVAPLPPKLTARDLPSGPDPTPPRAQAPAPVGPCGGVVAKVVTASRDPAWSFASLSPSPTEPATVHRVGERVGNYTVASIDWDRVWLAHGSSRCAVEVHPGFLSPGQAARRGRAQAEQPSLALLSPDITDGMEKRSETEFSMLARSVDAIFARGTELLAGLRIEPVRREGTVTGIELDSIPSGSLLERLGLESGDVLLAINDELSQSPEAAVRALERARRTTRMVARLERKGEPFELEVRVE